MSSEYEGEKHEYPAIIKLLQSIEASQSRQEEYLRKMASKLDKIKIPQWLLNRELLDEAIPSGSMFKGGK